MSLTHFNRFLFFIRYEENLLFRFFSFVTIGLWAAKVRFVVSYTF